MIVISFFSDTFIIIDFFVLVIFSVCYDEKSLLLYNIITCFHFELLHIGCPPKNAFATIASQKDIRKA